ncbi:MAG TPA: serine hydrolase domain-containing protein [Mucilaginibacter sp.]|nr:serine hydrolase domain-containing protein [Mucilaginibacter sp.]
MPKIFVFIILLFVANFGYSQSFQDTVAQIDKLFSNYKLNQPGCELAICRNGVVIYSKAWGTANLEDGVPLTANSILEAGSVSKQFTAAAILLLAQQGKLSLDDNIRKYLPEIPNYGESIRIKHLLHHTSGIRDWGAIADIANWPRSTKTYSNDDVLDILSRQKALNNKPGAEFIYSNSNYNLLAIIVKRVSGMSLAEFTRKYIFEPAGMSYTQWRDNFKRIVSNRAVAYDKTDAGYEADMPNETAYGNGGLLTTAEDLLRWLEYDWAGKFGNPSLLTEQVKVDHLNNGLANDYGMGLFISKREGWDYIFHDGATAGYRAFLSRYPQLKLSFAFLSNVSTMDIAQLHKLEDIFVPERNKAKSIVNEKPSYPMSVAKLKAFAGWYMNGKTGDGQKLTVVNDTLRTTHFKLKPISANSFAFGENRLVFRSKDFLFIPDSKDATEYIAIKAPADTGLDYLRTYAHHYKSTETGSECSMLVKNNKLIWHRAPCTDIELKPTYLNGFTSVDGDDSFHFFRGAKGKITGFKISVNRARNVEFTRTD